MTIACDAIRIDPNDQIAVDQIAESLRHWNEIGQPLQLFESHMHREDALARDLYFHVRELCLWLANDKGQFAVAQKITRTCADIFKQFPRALSGKCRRIVNFSLICTLSKRP